MRSVTGALVFLLSLLMASTSASASVCDLSCWLHQFNPDCHNAASAPADDGMTMVTSPTMPMDSSMQMGSMSMDSAEIGSGMNMGGGQTEGLPMSRRVAQTKSFHFMPVSMDTITDSFQWASHLGFGSSPCHGHSQKTSSCIHAACVQNSSSAYPPNLRQSQPNFLQTAPVGILDCSIFWTVSNRIAFPSPPADTVSVAHLSTTLRI